MLAKLKDMDLPIEGMHCASCVLLTNKTLGKVDGIENVEADLASNKVHLTVNPKKVSLNQIENEVKNIGFEIHTDEITLKLQGMHCASCVMNVENFLKRLDGVFEVRADLTTQTARINYDKSKVSVEDFEKVIDSLGFEVLGVEGQLEVDEEALYQEDLKSKLRRIVVGLIFSVILMAIMYVKWQPFGLTTGQISLIISILPFIYVSYPILKAGISGLLHKNLNMDVMYSMGVLVAFVSSVLGTFNIVLNHSFMFYETALMLPSFLMIGRYLESRAKKSTTDSIKELIGLQPTTATLVEFDENGEVIAEKDISISEIKIGDIFLVRPGDQIPADGEVVRGHSYVDESMINGEPIPNSKAIDDEVFAGTINQDNVLYIKALKIGQETVLSNIIRLVEKAQSSRPPVQKIADTAVSYFIPVVLAIAIAVFCIWYFIFDSTLLFALTTLISILVVACPCSLGLATPTAVTVGIGRAAEYGILIKNGDVLEIADKINVAAFDKTGTITEGKPEVDDIIPYGISHEEVLYYIASVENNSTHPIAKSIIRKSKEENIELTQVSNFENITGKGLKAEIDNEVILAGNRNLLEYNDIVISDEILSQYDSLLNESKTVIFLAIAGEIKGILSLSDKIKDTSKRTIEELHKMGIKTYMLTGDNENTAKTVANAVGIDDVRANVLPEDKLNIVKNLQEDENKVVFVGDGINDAPALTQADIGVAMGNGTDIAMESGDVVVMEGDLENVVAAIQFSKKVMTRIKQNIFWAFAYNSVLIPVAAGALFAALGIMFRPELSGLAMALSSVTVISLSLALKGYVPPIKKAVPKKV